MKFVQVGEDDMAGSHDNNRRSNRSGRREWPELGHELRRLWQQSGMKQEKLAGKMGYGVRHFHKILEGKRRPLKCDLIGMLKILEVNDNREVERIVRLREYPPPGLDSLRAQLIEEIPQLLEGPDCTLRIELSTSDPQCIGRLLTRSLDGLLEAQADSRGIVRAKIEEGLLEVKIEAPLEQTEEEDGLTVGMGIGEGEGYATREQNGRRVRTFAVKQMGPDMGYGIVDTASGEWMATGWETREEVLKYLRLDPEDEQPTPGLADVPQECAKGPGEYCWRTGCRAGCPSQERIAIMLADSERNLNEMTELIGRGVPPSQAIKMVLDLPADPHA
jgi:transcriptional regulator with XRE-family HTH domain